MKYTGERLIPKLGVGNIEEHQRLYDESLKHVAGLEVLDIACGSGWGTDQLAGKAKTICGCDISPEAVDYASANYKGTYQVGSILDIPFKSGTFDVVNSIETFEHICHDDVNQMVSEVCRVLKPGGLYLFSTPDHNIFPYHPSCSSEYRGWHRWHYTIGELESILCRCFDKTGWMTITKGHYVISRKR
jgi:2-polyprenyl-3-methyl-5-hydroxy-6-metoxy-1,4-benzoquinol methylase